MVPSSLGCGSTVFAAIAIFAPSAAALSAIARPIPREPPVMKRVLPCKDIGATVSWQLFCERCLRAFNAVGALRYHALETVRLDREIFSEITCERCAGSTVSGAQRCKRIFSQHAAAGGIAEQAQVGCSPREGGIGRLLCKQPVCGAFEAVNGFAKTGRCFAKGGRIARLDGPYGAPQFVNIESDRLATFEWQFSRYEIKRLNPVSAFIDRSNPCVAKMLCRAGLLDVTHAAMNLNAEGSNLASDIR